MADRSGTFRMSFDAETQESSDGVRLSDVGPVIRRLRPYSLRVAVFLLSSALSAWVFIRIPKLIGQVIDLFANVMFSSIIKGSSQVDTDQIIPLLLQAAGLLLAGAVLSVFQGFISSGICSSLTHRLREQIAGHILSVKADFLNSRSWESTERLATERIDTVGQSLNIVFSQGLPQVFLLAAIQITLFTIDPMIAMILLLVFPLYELIRRMLLIPKRVSYTAESVPVAELFQHIPDIRASGAAESAAASYETAERAGAKLLRSRALYGSLQQLLPKFLLGTALAAALAVGVRDGPDNGLTVGALISVIFYVLKEERPLSDSAQIFSAFGTMAHAMRDLDSFLQIPAEGSDSGAYDVPVEEGAICFDNITFRYPTGSTFVFRDFSCVIPERGITALVGATGVGKTTLLNLLLRFYMPQGGQIRYADRDISNMDLQNYRGMFSVISQQSVLFDATIADNISYPQTDAEPDALYEAAKAAGIEDCIASLPQGFETMCTAGQSVFSDGEVQQILLARALFRKSRIIVLDEAFSFVDHDEEERLFEQIRKIARDSSVILISHRDSISSRADTIIHITDQE
ncbi:MAG: ABC transporter ATP-binding protein/permease [Clostridia bacterium]|nr:ABC transporter ATP-binding protein/permease [Clostridia bacterium]